MTLRPLDWLGWLLAFAVGVGFFLPWLKFPAHPEPVRALRAAIVQELTSDSDRPKWAAYLTVTPEEWNRAMHDAGLGTSGLEIPQIYNDSKHRREVAQLNASNLLGKERQGDRALFVYAFPVLATFAAAFITFVPRKAPLILPLLACAGLYAFVRFKLNETYLDRLTSSLDVGLGLWLSLYALLGLALVLFLRLLLPENTRL